MRSLSKLIFTVTLASQVALGGLAMAAIPTAAQAPQDFIVFGGGAKGRGVIDKSQDKKLQSMLKETVHQFKQYTYKDAKSGRTIAYNLFLPTNYKPEQKYPLLMFIADASTVGNDLATPLKQGYSPAVWTTAKAQAKHPCIVLVPQYQGVVIDDHNGFKVAPEVEATADLVQHVAQEYNADTNRIYSTGQSMGCMITMYLAAKHPDLFAATMLVSGQWDVNELKSLAKQKFFYIAAGGDEKASQGQKDLLSVLLEEGAKVSTAAWDATQSYEELSKKAIEEIDQGNPINFATFVKNTVLPTNAKDTNEHMYSFDHAYQITAIRDWLFAQHK